MTTTIIEPPTPRQIRECRSHEALDANLLLLASGMDRLTATQTEALLAEAGAARRRIDADAPLLRVGQPTPAGHAMVSDVATGEMAGMAHRDEDGTWSARGIHRGTLWSVEGAMSRSELVAAGSAYLRSMDSSR